MVLGHYSLAWTHFCIEIALKKLNEGSPSHSWTKGYRLTLDSRFVSNKITSQF